MCSNKSKKVYDVCAENYDKDSDSDGGESFFVSVIAKAPQGTYAEDWYETLRGECGVEKFKLDTGADINVLSLEKFLLLGYDVSLINDKSKIKLQSYSGNIIPIKGICDLKWSYKNILYTLKFAIASISCQSVLGRQACIELGLVKRVYDINLSKYDHLFRGIGCLPGTYSIVIDKSVSPVVSAPRKIPLSLRDKLLGELNRMLEAGVIRKVTHPTQWVNSLVIAAKKNGGIRLCLDPRPLNCAIQRAHFQLPTINEIATKLHGAQYFSVLDANSGFWAIQLDDKSADLCTFSSPLGGRYQFLRLPFGLNCAPEVFHSTLKQLLEDLEGVDLFIDDIICWGKTKNEHDQRLTALLNRAEEINLKFNKDKCKICVSEVVYLGHVFNKSGMKPDAEKVKAIINMPVPNDKKSLERFLGATNYLSKFIPNYSTYTVHLTRLLRKESTWYWDDIHNKAISKLKELVSRAPVLALYDVSRPVVLSVDASSVALGAVLLQDGRPVEYASRTLTDTQTRYAQIEKELFAIVYACEKYHQYIYGKKSVIVETDHKPLESIFKKALASNPMRLQRMLLRLQGYDLIIKYVPGKYMYIADTLSRAPLPDSYESELDKKLMYEVSFLIDNVQMSANKLNLVRSETSKDKDLNQLCEYIIKGWPKRKCDISDILKPYWSLQDELIVVDGIIFKNKLILIPCSLRSQMLNIVHDGHLGIDRCKKRAREVLFWPGITKDIELYVKRCAVCQENSNMQTKEPLIPIQIPRLPWNKIGADIFEYRKQYYLILVDYYSGFVEVNYLKNITSKSVITAMKENFSRYGIPEILFSDNATNFTSRDFKKFSIEWGFDHVTSSPNYPQSNGKSERAVQTVKRLLIKSINSNSDFYLNLLSYRNTPRDSKLSSPAQLLMGRRLNCRLPVHPGLLEPKPVSKCEYDKLVNRQIKSKRYYDQHCKLLPELDVGDQVIIHDQEKQTRGQVIMKASAPRSYMVQNRYGRIYRRNRRHLRKCEPEDHHDCSEPLPQPSPSTSVTTAACSSPNADCADNVKVENNPNILPKRKAKKLYTDIQKYL
ncbi:uncharacterized protein K02A2.6-like [Bicyclus anynana]|uniref:RNA-directed DNA polymerase n=1 Tax=Bicyclus anynana TaxID=110368 RepID=A0ABM3M684_BICAN|nr:uncharacterized protein K02A2.6-like [Bicyclus anynana]